MKSAFVKTFVDFASDIKVSKSAVIESLRNSIYDVIESKFGVTQSFDVIVDADYDSIQILHDKLVVKNNETISDDMREIHLSDAKKISQCSKVGDVLTIDLGVSFFSDDDFRKLKSNFSRKIKDIKRNNFYLHYKHLVGSLISVEVSGILRNCVVAVDSDGNEFFIKSHYQIPNERYTRGEIIKALVSEVKEVNGNIVVILSRSSDLFLERLLESEIREISEGLIVVKKIARIPGEKSKIVVESIDKNVDAVKACIGVQASRVDSILKELKNERIDFIQYSDNIDLLVVRSLGLQSVRGISILRDYIFVYVDQDQLGLAIGKNGVNIKLVRMLLGQYVDVFMYNPNYDNGIVVEELVDSIDPWVVVELKNKGYKTITDVLNVDPKVLEETVDLEKETVNDIYKASQKKLKASKQYS